MSLSINVQQRLPDGDWVNCEWLPSPYTFVRALCEIHNVGYDEDNPRSNYFRLPIYMPVPIDALFGAYLVAFVDSYFQDGDSPDFAELTEDGNETLATLARIRALQLSGETLRLFNSH